MQRYGWFIHTVDVSNIKEDKLTRKKITFNKGIFLVKVTYVQTSRRHLVANSCTNLTYRQALLTSLPLMLVSLDRMLALRHWTRSQGEGDVAEEAGGGGCLLSRWWKARIASILSPSPQRDWCQVFQGEGKESGSWKRSLPPLVWREGKLRRRRRCTSGRFRRRVWDAAVWELPLARNPFYAEEFSIWCLLTIFLSLPTCASFLPALLPTFQHALLHSSTVQPDAFNCLGSSAQCVDWAVQIPPGFCAWTYLKKSHEIYHRTYMLYISFSWHKQPRGKKKKIVFVNLKL